MTKTMSIKAGVVDRSRKLTTAFVSPAEPETKRAWLNYSLPARPQEGNEQTMRNISLGLEQTMHNVHERSSA